MVLRLARTRTRLVAPAAACGSFPPRARVAAPSAALPARADPTPTAAGRGPGAPARRRGLAARRTGLPSTAAAAADSGREQAMDVVGLDPGR